MPRLMKQISDEIRKRDYSPKTEESYKKWIKDYVIFNGKIHPAELNESHVEKYLTHLALDRNLAPASQDVAKNSIVFLYKSVLNLDLGDFSKFQKSKRHAKIPVVLSKNEAKLILAQLDGTVKLICSLLYGSGLRLMEALRLRIKDVDFEMDTITVHDAKGNKDRVTLFPNKIKKVMELHLRLRQKEHNNDLFKNRGYTTLPYSLAKKYPSAAAEFGWQYIFVSPKYIKNDANKICRHHIYETTIQRAVKKAAKSAGIIKPATTHTFRHSFATHLLESGYNIRTVQELLGHKSVKTTMIYTHVMNKGGFGVRSPLD